MHIHCRFLAPRVAGTLLAQNLPTGLLQAQTVSAGRWVISALARVRPHRFDLLACRDAGTVVVAGGRLGLEENGPGTRGLVAFDRGGSPGGINRTEPADCAGQDAPVSVIVGVNGLPALRWQFPSAGHSVLLRMVRWPDGTLVNTQGLDLAERQGEWTWTGKDSSGNPVPPGGLIWDVRWWGRTCRGRLRERLRVPGHP